HAYYHARTNPLRVTVTDKRSGSGSDGGNVQVGLPAAVYVDDDWVSATLTADPDGAGPAHYFGRFDGGAGDGPQGGDAFGSVNEAVAVVAAGGTVYVYAGSYAERVDLAKAVEVQLLGNAGITALAGVAAAGVATGTQTLTI